MQSVSKISPTGSGFSTTTFTLTEVNDQISESVDQEGNQRSYAYTADNAHTIVTIKNSAGTVIDSYVAGFNANGSITSVTDGTQSTVIYSAAFTDPNDPVRPSQVEDGDGREWFYSYDTYGHVLTYKTPRNVTTTYTYAYTAMPVGLLSQVQEGSLPATSFTYYSPSNLLKSATGPTADGSTGTVSYTYSSLGNVLTSTAPGNETSSSIVTTYGYTTDGTYTQPEALGEPITVTDNLGYVSHVRYDTYGRPSSAWDPLGNTLTALYNLADQPTQITYPATDQTGTGQGYGHSYSFLYDGDGNPTTFRSATTPYTTKDQINKTGYVFGLDGNPTTYATETASADAEDRVAGFTGYDAMAYGPDGLRTSKTVSGVTTYYINEGGVPILELGSTGAVTATDTFGPDGLISRNSGGASTFYQFDQSGSTAARLNSSGAVLTDHAVDAFGAPLVSPTATDPYDGFGAQFGYYTDHETGLELLGQRLYDYKTGRFLNRDPIGFDGGFNQYRYCDNSPLSAADPSGCGPSDIITHIPITGPIGISPEGLQAISDKAQDYGNGALDHIHAGWCKESNWVFGRDHIDPDGHRVHVRGIASWFNVHGNAETYNGTIHLHDELDYEYFITPSALHWRDHEEGHLIQGEDISALEFGWEYANGAVAGAVIEDVGVPLGLHPSDDGLGHDYNPLEIDAENHANVKEGLGEIGFPPHDYEEGIPVPFK